MVACREGGGQKGCHPGSALEAPLQPLHPALQEILNYISRKEFEPLLRVDQLNLEREKHKVFLRFSEWGWKVVSEDPGVPGSLWP